MQKKLYHHKTGGGAEYLTDQFITAPNGDKEGVFENAQIIVRIDGDIKRDAEISIADEILKSN
jgi:hypothetical protein